MSVLNRRRSYFQPKRSATNMKLFSTQLRFCSTLTVTTLCFLAPALLAQPATAKSAAAQEENQHMRSRLFIYDLRDSSTHLVFTADTVWEAPNWSPDGTYLISNSHGGIFKFVLKADNTADPQKLTIPADYLDRKSTRLNSSHLVISYAVF